MHDGIQLMLRKISSTASSQISCFSNAYCELAATGASDKVPARYFVDDDHFVIEIQDEVTANHQSGTSSNENSHPGTP
jgi:hypothetical protein